MCSRGINSAAKVILTDYAVRMCGEARNIFRSEKVPMTVPGPRYPGAGKSRRLIASFETCQPAPGHAPDFIDPANDEKELVLADPALVADNAPEDAEPRRPAVFKKNFPRCFAV